LTFVDKEENVQINMEDTEGEEYNVPYKIEELENALASCTTGPQMKIIIKC
jgi:hypothetical protein